VGSLLLTPQENESLFSFLGKKCVVSGRDPRRRPDVTSRAWVGAGGGSEKKAGPAREVPPPPRPLAGPVPRRRPGPVPRVRAGPAGEQGSVTSQACAAAGPAGLGLGLRPGCWVKLYSWTTGDFFFFLSWHEPLNLRTGPRRWPPLHLCLLDLGILLNNARGVRSGQIERG
jgi:hypothetical protein